MENMTTPRWHAEVDYRTDSGIVSVPHDFEEIEDLHELIERGPDFYTIQKIVIWPQGACASETLTVEQSLQQ